MTVQVSVAAAVPTVQVLAQAPSSKRHVLGCQASLHSLCWVEYLPDENRTAQRMGAGRSHPITPVQAIQGRVTGALFRVCAWRKSVWSGSPKAGNLPSAACSVAPGKNDGAPHRKQGGVLVTVQQVTVAAAGVSTLRPQVVAQAPRSKRHVLGWPFDNQPREAMVLHAGARSICRSAATGEILACSSVSYSQTHPDNDTSKQKSSSLADALLVGYQMNRHPAPRRCDYAALHYRAVELLLTNASASNKRSASS